MDRKKIIMLSGAVGALVLIATAVMIFMISTAGGIADAETMAQANQPPAVTGPNAIAASFSVAPTSLGDITISAQSATHLGVDINSAFLISSDVINLTEEYIRQHLSVSDNAAFSLTRQSDGIFLLQFDNALENHRVYNFIYQPADRQTSSIAFQTADIFRITSTSPANHAHSVPQDAGIEITFSQPLADNFEDFFSIEPPVGGRFLQRDNTHIFVPDGLELGTRYVVTIARGLVSIRGEVINDEHSFAFNTNWGTSTERPFSVSGSAYETFLPWDEVFIALNVAQHLSNRNFNVRLYDLQNAENFINYNENTVGNLIDTFEITAAEFEGDHQSFFYLFLEQVLPPGYYVAEVRSNQSGIDNVEYKFIQVSALSVYSLSIEGEAVFWLHDAATGQPASGAQIVIDGTTAATSNAQGIATATTDGGRNTQILINHSNHLPFAYTKPTYATRNFQPSDRFLSYMHTDRPAYRPNDTIDVFGVVLPRYGHSHRPDDVFTLHIGNMIELPITLDAYSSFALRIPVKNMFGHANIEIRVNGEFLTSAWTRFLDYTNRSFIIDGNLDRLAYFSGDIANAEISVETFGGFPAEGISMRSDNVTLTTDAHGIAAGRLPVPSWSGDWWRGWQPYWNSAWFWVVNDTQASQSISMPMIIAPSDIMMEFDYEGGTTAFISTNRILIDRLNTHYSGANMWTTLDPDVFRGPAVDVDFTVEITRHTTTRTLVRQNYDHINRRNINVYSFDTTSQVISTERFSTADGTALLENLPVSNDPMIRYGISIHYNDSAGRAVTVRLSDNSWRHFRQESSIRHFGLHVADSPLRVGQTTTVSVFEGDNWWWDDGDLIEITEGRLLTVFARDGVISATAGNPAGVPLTFTESAITSATVYGAYFDGQYIFPITWPSTVVFDHTQRELDISLNFDRETYSPGQDVTVTIQTSRPAQVAISVVDESSILSSHHNANFLQRLYQSSWGGWGQFHQFASFTQHNFGGAGGGAEGGGGEGGGGEGLLRERFIDNPIFETIQTDAQGRATLTFTLPDQVTSWRVTALGLTIDGYAGDARENILSTLDFYVDLILTNEYIVGDDIVALARVFGAQNQPVEYEFNIRQADDSANIAANTQTSGRNTTFNAGKLPSGEYIMRVVARSGGFADAIELPFSVVDSGMIMPQRMGGHLDDGIAYIEMRNMPVRVTLTNADIGPVIDILHSIAHHGSYRTDHIAAAAYINYFFSGEQDFSEARHLIHQPWQGIAELVYEQENFEYTARFAASFPEFVNEVWLLDYIDREIGLAPGRQHAAGLLALAALNQPVLRDIYSAITPETDGMELLYLVAALVAIGDDEGAANALASFNMSQISSGQTEQETAAALLLFINATLDPQAAWAIVNRSATNVHVSDVPERINFVRRTRFLGATVSEVQYTIDGATHTARLQDLDRLTLQLTAQQFDALNLTPISGGTSFTVDFYGYGEANWDDAGNRVNIRRTITQEGDLLRVDIHVTIPNDAPGFYMINDRLPSNLRFVPQNNRRDISNPFFVRHVQRQLVEIGFSVGNGLPHTRTLTYYAMELFEADMAPGTTYVSNRSTTNHVWGKTE